MTRRNFLRGLDKLKTKFKWAKTNGMIRTKSSIDCPELCPMQAYHMSKTGRRTNHMHAASSLEICDNLVDTIIVSADFKDSKNRFRQAMLRRLGLESDNN